MKTILNRFTGKVMCGGLSLEVVLEQHRKWVYGQEGGSRAVLRGADLRGAVLRGAVLRDADLSRGLSGVPFIKDIHQTVYAAASKPGCLDMSSWHYCETTHCRAGWVVTLAGEGGKALEWAMGTPAAAAMIYLKSDPSIEKIPDFYADNDDALEDMKRLAELEAARGLS